ncbi:MAG: YkgJ family cysteine cluster protein [Gammaproteobacteria bacterium]|nr:YkgJ family cysteine cluster protein [Gammaproteobacteria bacterium]
MASPNPCLSCGACCAHFRASFYWAEGDDATPDGVPVGLTDQLTPHLRVMKGTDQPGPRCCALLGDIGQSVRCTIHPRRSSVCREFVPSWEDGQHNPRCDSARARWSLPPLMPEDWIDPTPTIPGEPGVTVAA